MRNGLAVVILLSTCAGVAHAKTIAVDGSTTHQTMAGWINQLRVWDDRHVTNTYRPAMGTEDTGRSAVDIPLTAQAEILDKLYGELGLTHVQARRAGRSTSNGSGTTHRSTS